ncbi:MAG: lipase maturation factor family protein [Candidatus Omnitrophica bacterium]|nr:lipase maturation factor family protein [Candidatus Omnitrophota bacterium]
MYGPPRNEKRGYRLTRLCLQRGLAFIYLTGFLIAVHQFLPLAGENGLYPVGLFLKRVTFWQAPGLFWLNPSDAFMLAAAWAGVFLSVLALSGFSEKYGPWFSGLVWFLLWVLYQSFVNAGQVFYGFGWETLLLECGFLAIFFGDEKTPPPAAIIWLIRWILFRLMFGAGLIKLRGDSCWRDLTCMYYFYETQPVPNPLSWFFHHLPPLFHKGEVLVNHFTELVVPWGFFLVQPVCAIAGILTILFHLILIISGNLAWLNYITIILCFSCFDDRMLSRVTRLKPPAYGEASKIRRGMIAVLTVFILVLSIPSAANLFSRRQRMNASFEPFHLVNTYGAFGGITRKRMEVVIEGTADRVIGPETEWREYEFKCKPGDVKQRPCLMSPYLYKLDWQIWFAAMNTYAAHPWILNLTAKLLENDKPVLSLLKTNPFPDRPPHYIRAVLYEYRFSTPEERHQSGQWWIRTPVRPYLPPLSLDNPSFLKILRKQQWI